MLGWFSNMFARPAPSAPSAPSMDSREQAVSRRERAAVLAMAAASRISARYEAAEPRDDLWNLASNASADAMLSPAKRQRMRNRARLEYMNNPLCSRIVKVYADDVCGDGGPTLQVQSGDRQTDNIIERAWNAWFLQARLLESLHTAILAYCIDGEAFAKRGYVGFHTIAEMLLPEITLRVVNFEADRVGSQWTSFEKTNYVDGVRFDPETGDPIEYDVMRSHPGSNAIDRASFQSDTYGADIILHAFRKTRAEQHRGVTPLAPALTTSAEHRKFLTATRRAAEHAATFSAIFRNLAPPDLDSEPVIDEDAWYETVGLPNSAGNVMFLPDNQTIEQFKAEHPNTAFGEFHRIMTALMAGCFSMPLGRALGFTEISGYAPNRADLLPYTRRIAADRQQMWEPLWLTPIYYSWLQEFLLSPLAEGVTTEGTNVRLHRWDWSSGDLIVDPSRDEAAREKRMAMGITSRVDEITTGNLDEHDKRAAESFGMTVEDYRAAIARKLFGSAPAAPTAEMDDFGDDPEAEPAMQRQEAAA